MLLGGLSSSDDVGGKFQYRLSGGGSVGLRSHPGFLRRERTLVAGLELTVVMGLVDTTDGEALFAAAREGPAVSRVAPEPEDEHPFGVGESGQCPSFPKPGTCFQVARLQRCRVEQRKSHGNFCPLLSSKARARMEWSRIEAPRLGQISSLR